MTESTAHYYLLNDVSERCSVHQCDKNLSIIWPPIIT